MKYFDENNRKVGKNVIVYEGAQIGEGVSIGDFSIVYPNVTIQDGTQIGPYCTIGEPTAAFYRSNDYVHENTIIGENSLIRSHTIIYSGVEIGANFQTGHRVTIREEARIGKNVRIGTLSDIQGYCEIGDYVNLHSNVHIGQKSKISDYVWIFPYVILTNDPTPPSYNLLGVTIEKFAIIATGSVILPGIVVGENSLVGAQSLVKKDVPKEMVVAGNPAVEICSIMKIKNKSTGEPAYPWMYKFDRGMPWEGIGFEKWNESRKTDIDI